MNKQQLAMMWDHIRQMHGIGLRAVQALPADKLDSRPIPNMRTPKELVIHTYGMCVRAIAESVLHGKVADLDEKTIVPDIKTKDDLVNYVRASWAAADKAAASATDAQLQSIVKTDWGVDFPGYVMFGIVHDEYAHHRGQLYAYLRALGVEPPMVWDFEHNEPAFQPKASANA